MKLPANFGRDITREELVVMDELSFAEYVKDVV